MHTFVFVCALTLGWTQILLTRIPVIILVEGAVIDEDLRTDLEAYRRGSEAIKVEVGDV